MTLAAAAIYYAVPISFFAVGFRRVRREAAACEPVRIPGSPPFVSLVVAARNEAPHLEACLHAILANDYPADRFEVVVVDDFSDDETAAVVQLRRYGGPARHPPWKSRTVFA